MRIPIDATIAEDKLSHYLLVERPFDDKSAYLKLGGFTQKNRDLLRRSIRELTRTVDAVESEKSIYGTLFQIEGVLEGPHQGLRVRLIWMQRAIDEGFHFVTLVPLKR